MTLTTADVRAVTPVGPGRPHSDTIMASRVSPVSPYSYNPDPRGPLSGSPGSLNKDVSSWLAPNPHRLISLRLCAGSATEPPTKEEATMAYLRDHPNIRLGGAAMRRTDFGPRTGSPVAPVRGLTLPMWRWT